MPSLSELHWAELNDSRWSEGCAIFLVFFVTPVFFALVMLGPWSKPEPGWAFVPKQRDGICWVAVYHDGEYVRSERDDDCNGMSDVDDDWARDRSQAPEN